MSTHRLLIVWILAIFASVLLGLSALADATPWVKFKIADRSLLLESQVEGVPGYSALKMTKHYNYLDTNWLASSGLELKKTGTVKAISGKGWYSKSNVFTNVSTKVLGFDAQLGDLIETDTRVNGVQMELGLTFSDNFVFQFDFRRSMVRLLSRGSIDLKTGSTIESRKEPRLGYPSIKVRLTKQRSFWLAIQPFENYGVSVERTIAEKHRWLNGATKLNPNPTSNKFPNPALEFTLSNVGLGGIELENVSGATPLVGKLMSSNPRMNIDRCPLTFCEKIRSKGMLGMDILKHFIVTIDFKEGLVHFDSES